MSVWSLMKAGRGRQCDYSTLETCSSAPKAVSRSIARASCDSPIATFWYPHSPAITNFLPEQLLACSGPSRWLIRQSHAAQNNPSDQRSEGQYRLTSPSYSSAPGCREYPAQRSGGHHERRQSGQSDGPWPENVAVMGWLKFKLVRMTKDR